MHRCVTGKQNLARTGMKTNGFPCTLLGPLILTSIHVNTSPKKQNSREEMLSIDDARAAGAVSD